MLTNASFPISPTKIMKDVREYEYRVLCLLRIKFYVKVHLTFFYVQAILYLQVSVLLACTGLLCSYLIPGGKKYHGYCLFY